MTLLLDSNTGPGQVVSAALAPASTFPSLWGKQGVRGSAGESMQYMDMGKHRGGVLWWWTQWRLYGMRWGAQGKLPKGRGIVAAPALAPTWSQGQSYSHRHYLPKARARAATTTGTRVTVCSMSLSSDNLILYMKNYTNL